MEDVAQKIYDFTNVLEKLCFTQRDMFFPGGRKECDSDHIMKLSFLLIMVLPYVKQPINQQRVLELAIVHDLVEAEVGDTPRVQCDHIAEVKAKKKMLEHAAIEKYRDMLPEPIGQKVYDLFMEYENRETPESKLVKIFDKFEGDMQTFKEDDTILRKLKNGRHEFILDYLRKDLSVAESSGETIVSELQKIQLNKAEKIIEDMKLRGLLEEA
ncbi:MAG: HD domain-containing protein [Alphaproteobacteria bacterium]|nr:HD domain-containing protein [Alphaproteobacteria bacterium]